ncbi:hypothetical protein [Clostridium paraputrificum]|uniref:hypothetical protein n=1 Tax=Clostridium paraputrificum TaxID=29363 RepID=UPI0006C06767|nr:hypothetical protein [Clostridium paraputrificum]CUO75793.1 Uncharacterised protein [Clostridium paraputrificum]
MSTIEKIVIKENTTLRLRNVLIRQASENELIDINEISYMMNSYIKSKGNLSIGPIINYSTLDIDENGQAKVILKLMVQLKNPIFDIEKPYELKEELKITNCLFARFTEKEENLQFVYQKLGVYAFENNIKLKGDSYTVFVKQEEENIVVDVFMECLKGGDLLESI